MNCYNGFTAKERARFLDPGVTKTTVPAHGPCAICLDPRAPVVYHSEDYSWPPTWVPPATHAVCKSCHNRIHARFSRPWRWEAYKAHVRRGGYGSEVGTRSGSPKLCRELTTLQEALAKGRPVPEMRTLRERPESSHEWWEHLAATPHEAPAWLLARGFTPTAPDICLCPKKSSPPHIDEAVALASTLAPPSSTEAPTEDFACDNTEEPLSLGIASQIFEMLLPDLDTRRLCAQLLADAIRTAARVNPKGWAVSWAVRLSGPFEWLAFVPSNEVIVVVDAERLPRARIMALGATIDEYQFATHVPHHRVLCPVAVLPDAFDDLRAGLLSLIKRTAHRNCKWRRHHVTEIIVWLRDFLQEPDLPDVG